MTEIIARVTKSNGDLAAKMQVAMTSSQPVKVPQKPRFKVSYGRIKDLGPVDYVRPRRSISIGKKRKLPIRRLRIPSRKTRPSLYQGRMKGIVQYFCDQFSRICSPTSYFRKDNAAYCVKKSEKLCSTNDVRTQRDLNKASQCVENNMYAGKLGLRDCLFNKELVVRR